MAIELNVNGYFRLEFYDNETGDELNEKQEQEILNKLQSGEYLFSMENRKVVKLEDFSKVCDCYLEVTDSVEYEFDEI